MYEIAAKYISKNIPDAIGCSIFLSFILAWLVVFLVFVFSILFAIYSIEKSCWYRSWKFKREYKSDDDFEKFKEEYVRNRTLNNAK